MPDIIDRAQAMITTIDCPHLRSVTNVVSELLVEVREWRLAALNFGAVTPSDLQFITPGVAKHG